MSDTSIPAITKQNELASLSVALGLFPLIVAGLIAAQLRFAPQPTDNDTFLSPHILHIASRCGMAMACCGLLIAAWVAWRNHRAGKRLWLALIGLALNPITIVILVVFMRKHY